MIFPGLCCDCGRLFSIRSPGRHGAGDAAPEAAFEELLGSFLCRACASQFRAIGSPLCTRCGEPFSGDGPNHECGLCRNNPTHFDAARACGLYEGPLRALIHRLKYQRCDQLAAPLGRLLWRTLILNWPPDMFDRVVPVPLHPRRLRERGFNQARLLVRQWPVFASRFGFNRAPDWIDTDLLKRQRATLPQTGLKKEQRATNLHQAFVVDKPIDKESILLVDDVMTTGMTAETCALALRRAGAAEVRVLTLARAVL